MKIALTDIIVKERQRLDLGDCTSLADSLRDTGQIQAIGLNERNELIWGRRRLEAARILGWTEIEAVKREGLSPEQEQEIEYEEDARRKNRSWQENCIAVAKLFRIKKERTGDDWSIRRMADFTGHGKTNVGYMKIVAQYLLASPKDEEMWACENYLAAVKLHFIRVHAEVTKELERRRALFVAAATVDKYADEPPVADSAAPNAEPVRQSDATPEAIEVRVYGTERAITDVPLDDLVEGRTHTLLAYNPPLSLIPYLRYLLASNGWAVLFFDNIRRADDFAYAAEDGEGLDGIQLRAQPHLLVWNKVATVASEWPFSNNTAYGVVLTKDAPHLQACRSSVISATQDDPRMLPPALIEAVINAVCPADMPVYCLGGVPPAYVAATGHTPLWYEPNPELFALYDAALVQHYEENIPGVVIKRRAR